MKPDDTLNSEEEQYCTLQYAVAKFNRENDEFHITLSDLLRFGELNLIHLKFKCYDNLRLVIWDPILNIENEIGIYLYGSTVEILDYKFDPEHIQEDNYFPTHKVRPINLDILKPIGISSPQVKSEFLRAPYYFVPEIYPRNLSNQGDALSSYGDCIVETDNLIFAKSDLPKINAAAERLMKRIEITIDEINIKPKFITLSAPECTTTNSAHIEAVKPWHIIDKNDPVAKQSWYICARYFARQLVKDDSTLLIKRELLSEKTAHCLQNAGILKRGNLRPLLPSTVKKAFCNVHLG